MIILVIFSNILLLSSLTGFLSNSISRVTNYTYVEYLYVYAVYVLEESASNRLIHFYPPFNLITFVIFNPWSLIFPESPTIIKAKIMALKITHLPMVGVIQAYEVLCHRQPEDEFSGFKGSAKPRGRNERPTMPQARPSSGQRRPMMPLPAQARTWHRAKDRAAEDIDEDTLMAAQIAELNTKIDKITTALLVMQENQSATSKAAVEAERTGGVRS
ncbi:hypothetical protein ACO1O0_003106 [Amphichorda felina]